MKKLLFALVAFATILSSCKKSDSFDATAQAATDDAAIQAYIKANNITATKDPSGVYYQILTPGTGIQPTVNSNVWVNYTGRFLDGTTFDSGTINNTPLTNLIVGWRIGIPYDKVGGRILLLIPSGLAYGHTPTNTSMRADAVLVFDVTLTNAQ